MLRDFFRRLLGLARDYRHLLVEGDFVRAILACPKDNERWLVDGDWLEEQGDCRSEYLRLRFCAGGCIITNFTERSRQLFRLSKQIDPDWIGLMERANRWALLSQ